MKGLSILNKMNGSLKKIGFKLNKKSPEILIILGVGGVVGSTILACKATTKLSEILDNTTEEMKKIKNYVEEVGYSEKYTNEDATKDTIIIYTQTGIKLFKLYAPAVTLGVVSLGCILTSNNILRKRNLALVAAYTGLDKTLKKYRDGVIERFGKDVDLELRHSIKTKKVDILQTDENGEEIKVKTNIKVADGVNEQSDYARYFDSSCPDWKNNNDYNLFFLKSQQHYANDKLRADGYLFLNEVYKMLGLPETKAGQVVGWIYEPDNDNIDNHVDFGIFNVHRDFDGEYEEAILLDFNVDGYILDIPFDKKR